MKIKGLFFVPIIINCVLDLLLKEAMEVDYTLCPKNVPLLFFQ